jgi:hypothetical protein
MFANGWSFQLSKLKFWREKVGFVSKKKVYRLLLFWRVLGTMKQQSGHGSKELGSDTTVRTRKRKKSRTKRNKTTHTRTIGNQFKRLAEALERFEKEGSELRNPGYKFREMVRSESRRMFRQESIVIEQEQKHWGVRNHGFCLKVANELSLLEFKTQVFSDVDNELIMTAFKEYLSGETFKSRPTTGQTNSTFHLGLKKGRTSGALIEHQCSSNAVSFFKHTASVWQKLEQNLQKFNRPLLDYHSKIIAKRNHGLGFPFATCTITTSAAKLHVDRNDCPMANAVC